MKSFLKKHILKVQQNIYTYIHNFVQGMSLENDMPRPQILFCEVIFSFSPSTSASQPHRMETAESLSMTFPHSFPEPDKGKTL